MNARRPVQKPDVCIIVNTTRNKLPDQSFTVVALVRLKSLIHTSLIFDLSQLMAMTLESPRDWDPLTHPGIHGYRWVRVHTRRSFDIK